MKSATPARKSTGPKKSRWGEKLTPEQVKKMETMFTEMDHFWGDRDTGSTEFLLKMRRGEI